MRLEQFLAEGKITKKDRKTLSQLIIDPEQGDFELQDGTEVRVETTRSGIDLAFPKENDELVMTLTEICDSLGYDFDHRERKGNIEFSIKK